MRVAVPCSDTSACLVRQALAGFSLAVLTLALVLLSACETPAGRQARENARTGKQAAKEMNRICALPEDKRDTELKRIKEQSGLVLYCGNSVAPRR